MRRKILKSLILTMTFAAVLYIFTGCNDNEESMKSKKTKNSGDNNYASAEDYSKESGANDNKNSYGLSSLKNIDELKDYYGKITDMSGYDTSYFLFSTDNSIYRESYGEVDELINCTNGVKSFNIFGTLSGDNYEAIIKKSDDTYSIFYSFISQRNINKSQKIEIKNVDATDALNMKLINTTANNDGNFTGGTLYLVRGNRNECYVDGYDVDSNGNATKKYTKLPFKYETLTDNSNEVYDVKQVYRSINQDEAYIVLADGSVHEGAGIGNGSASMVYDENSCKFPAGRALEPILKNVNKIYSCGSISKYSRPLYSQIGDNKNLYTYKSDNSIGVYGVPNDQYKITIPLPEGYTTEDIKNIVIEEDLLIEFNDGSIYESNKNKITELSYDEGLSDLNKKGKTKKFDVLDFDIVVLMDDKSIYKVEI